MRSGSASFAASGIGCVDRDGVFERRPPGRHRHDGRAVDRHLAIEARAGVGRERPPIGERRVPIASLRRPGATGEIGERRRIRRDKPGARAHLDRHVADRQPLLDGQGFDRRAGVFDQQAGAAADAEPGDDRQDEILCGRACREPAVDGDPHRLRRGLPQHLRRHRMRRFGGADTEGERTERAVRRGMQVAADDHQPRMGNSLLGSDDVQDSLAFVHHADDVHAELVSFILEPKDQLAPAFVGNAGVAARAARGGDEMIRTGDDACRPMHVPSTGAQRIDNAPPEPLVQENTIDIEQGLAVLERRDRVSRPNLLNEVLRLHGSPPTRRLSRHCARPSRAAAGARSTCARRSRAAAAAAWCNVRRPVSFPSCRDPH